MVELYWFVFSQCLERLIGDLNMRRYLQTQTHENGTKALQMIQSGANPGQVMEALNPSHPPRLQSEPSKADSRTEPDLSSAGIYSVRSFVAQAIFLPSNVITALEDGVEAFFACTGYIFHIYEQNEAQEILRIVRPCIRDAGEHWLQLMLQVSTSVSLKASLCSVCIMAAIGLQYTKDSTPALYYGSATEKGTHQYVIIFYELGKHFLEDAIENSAFEAMKVCAGLCVFNIIGRATIALANADMGINFARSLGSSFEDCSAGFSEAAWKNYKRVARTLETLRNWLGTSLGYVRNDDSNIQIMMHWLADQTDLSP